MNIQYLIGQNYYDYYREVYFELQKLGHDINIIYYSTALDELNTNDLLHRMVKSSDITLIDDPNALFYFNRLSIDDIYFPNLISIFFSINPLAEYCSPKPLIMPSSTDKNITYLINAIRIISNHPRRYLERTGNYKSTRYGFMLMRADEEPYAKEAWKRLYRKCTAKK